MPDEPISNLDIALRLKAQAELNLAQANAVGALLNSIGELIHELEALVAEVGEMKKGANG